MTWALLFNYVIPGQNGVWVKLSFWPKNDDEKELPTEKWPIKIICEIPPCACRNFKNIFYIV